MTYPMGPRYALLCRTETINAEFRGLRGGRVLRQSAGKKKVDFLSDARCPRIAEKANGVTPVLLGLLQTIVALSGVQRLLRQGRELKSHAELNKIVCTLL